MLLDPALPSAAWLAAGILRGEGEDLDLKEERTGESSEGWPGLAGLEKEGAPPEESLPGAVSAAGCCCCCCCCWRSWLLFCCWTLIAWCTTSMSRSILSGDNMAFMENPDWLEGWSKESTLSVGLGLRSMSLLAPPVRIFSVEGVEGLDAPPAPPSMPKLKDGEGVGPSEPATGVVTEGGTMKVPGEGEGMGVFF